MELSTENGYWQDLSDSKKLNYIYENGYLADCEFLVGPDDKTAATIKGHRLIFIMASPVFEKMLTGEFTEAKKSSKIRINDVEPNDFNNFCYMIYNNSSQLSIFSLEEIIVLYRLCDKYLVSSIVQKCNEHLKTLLNNSNVDIILTIYKFAFGLEDKSLLVEVKNKLKTVQVIADDKLLDLSEQEFYEYMLNQPNNTQPIKLFSAVNLYLTRNKLFVLEDDHNKGAKVKMDGDNNKSLRSRLLNLVNFNIMSTVEFINGPGKSRLLTDGQKFDMLSKRVQNIPITNNF